MVQGITHLVSEQRRRGRARARDGARRHRPAALDSLSRRDSPAGLASRELKMRSEVEQYLGDEGRADRHADRRRRNVRVQVSADINLDRVERTTESMDPESQVLTQRAALGDHPGRAGWCRLEQRDCRRTRHTRSVETFSGAVGNVKRVTAAVLVNDRWWWIDATARDLRGAHPRGARPDPDAGCDRDGHRPNPRRSDQRRELPFDDRAVDRRGAEHSDSCAFAVPAAGHRAARTARGAGHRLPGDPRTLKAPETRQESPKAGTKGANLNVVVGAPGNAPSRLRRERRSSTLPPPDPPTTRDWSPRTSTAHPDVAVKMIRSWIEGGLRPCQQP